MKENLVVKIVFSLAVVFFVAAQFYLSKHPQTSSEKAVIKAKIIGKRLIDSKFQRAIFLAESPSRGIASEQNTSVQTVEEGEIGRDPWGHPFFYKKLPDRLVIWSKGPNNKLDSSMNQIETNFSENDDIIVVVM